jgi:CcmD family protein
MDERNFTYMFYGFLAAWLVLVGYVVSLAGRERRLRKEIERLKHMIEDREKK